MKTTKTKQLACKNRQADHVRDTKRLTKNTMQHLGHFASKKVLKAGHNTDPMPKATPGRGGGIVDTIKRGMGIGSTKTDQPAVASPKTAAEAPQERGIYTENKGAQQQEKAATVRPGGLD